jgi:WD40 repeat protein
MRVRVFAWKKLRPLAILKLHSKSVTCVEFSPSANYLLSASGDKKIALWQLY